ncbi:helix-turn-helix domain-containing protein [Sphingomonas sp. RRHST34]|uniref:Helix-turn-helix domain-containing protein n=1 Tax=Sphingomonas citri TaxID=2862499 RepID=A0ABS7BQP6_9SPHN|nr:helix-turn-helix transcriptional regulator [Sphingomonas citri]MBW6531906.1 helix-turn-helix domain-containing protein [Sphingomonas citri]
MKLRDWLKKEGMEARDFAPLIGRTPEAVRRYVTGDRIPDKETMPLIAKATRGSVMPNDFFSISVRRVSAAAEQVAA